MASGYKITVSPDHPLWSYCNGVIGYHKAVEIQAELQRGAEVWMPVFISGHPTWTQQNYVTVRYEYMPPTKQPVGVHVTIDEDLAYVMGVLVGDGCLGGARLGGVGGRDVAFSSVDDSIIQITSSVLLKHFGVVCKRKNKCDYRFSCARKLRGFLRAMDMAHLAYTKYVPDVIVESPKSVVAAFLSGLFDTDGCADKFGRPHLNTVSSKLAHDVQNLLSAFGIHSYVSFKKNAFAGCWEVSMDGPFAQRFYSDIGFRLERKQERRARIPNKPFHPRMAYPPQVTPILKRIYDNRKANHVTALFSKRGGNRFAEPYVWGVCAINHDALEKFTHLLKCENDPELAQFHIGPNRLWRKVVKCTDTQADLYDLTVPGTHNFIANAIVNHNTRGVLHFICKHLWSCDRARVLIFAKTVKSASIAGSYKELVDDVLPEYINGNFGMHFTKDPSTDGTTRTSHFKVSNYYGTESECYLFSVAHEKEVEEKVKNIKGSLIFFIELSNFNDSIVLDATISQLRSDTVPYEHRVWIADTNPPEDGEDSWIHDVWFKRDTSNMDQEAAKVFGAAIAEYRFLPKDNPFLPPEEFAMLRAKYAHSQDLTNRYINGLWVKDNAKGHFAKTFSVEQHVVGNVQCPQEQREVIQPSENCMELLTGWDLGDMWHSMHILEKVFTEYGAVYCVLGELYNNGERISTREFTEVVMEKVDFYEKYILDNYKRKVSWRHWSDNSANIRYRAAADAYESNVVFAASNGRIKLMSAPKGAGSVRRRVRITQTLLHENRLFVSANCEGTVEMFLNLKKGRGEMHYVARDKFIHRFDSLSYVLDAEEPVDVQNKGRPTASKGRLVSV